LDGKQIIIFGGFFTGTDSLYVLDIINFEWYIPKVSETNPGYKIWHQANVVEKYIVISFFSVFINKQLLKTYLNLQI